MSAPDPETQTYFDALLRPNQSLSRPAFWVIMSIVAGANLISAFAFISSGAFPIIGFLGLDVLVVWLAFKACFKSQRQWTRVQITNDVLRVDHMNPKGEESSVELPTAFARIELKTPLTPNSWVTLAHRREAYVIGRFLTMDERHSLVEAMRDALQRARRHTYSSDV